MVTGGKARCHKGMDVEKCVGREVSICENSLLVISMKGKKKQARSSESEDRRSRCFPGSKFCLNVSREWEVILFGYFILFYFFYVSLP